MKVGSTLMLIFCTWAIDCSSWGYITTIPLLKNPTSCSQNHQHQWWEDVSREQFFLRGLVGRQVPHLQTSTVCLLIRSPGCHSIHHPTARHTAPLSRILQLQSGFHTHPLMTKPDTGTDSCSLSWLSATGDARKAWIPYPARNLPINACKSISTERLCPDIIWCNLRLNDELTCAREWGSSDKAQKIWGGNVS